MTNCGIIVESYRDICCFRPATLPAWGVHYIRETSMIHNGGENKVVEIIEKC